MYLDLISRECVEQVTVSGLAYDMGHCCERYCMGFDITISNHIAMSYTLP
jgi:hypothetical protein